MTGKSYMKVSEARVLIYLAHVIPQNRYAMAMSSKLDIEYGYLNKVLNLLKAKEWIRQGHSLAKNKVFYDLTELGEQQLNKATARLSAEAAQSPNPTGESGLPTLSG